MGAFHAVDFTVFGVPGYFFFSGTALVAAVCAFIIMMAEKKFPLQVHMRFLLVSIVCMLVSARLFGMLSGVYYDIGTKQAVTWQSVRDTGIVFYGGLIGLLVSYSALLKLKKQSARALDVLAVCAPLFHSIARVGCFFGGCCFGIESRGPLAIRYTTRVFDDIVTADRIPVQLIEAGFELCLFFVLLVLLRKDDREPGYILRKYLLCYSIGRFLIEFLRGDAVRGVVCGVSFSQLISVIIWIYLFFTYIREYKRRSKEELAL